MAGLSRRPLGGRPTLRHVADRAGVSFKTVSRVVNDEPGVRAETAERVLAAVAELGYQRNVLASSLKRGGGHDTIGLIIEDVSNPFFAVIARAVEEITRERGLLVIIASSDEDRRRERSVIDALISRRVKGLIIVPIGRDHRYLAREMRHGTAIVFLDRPPGNLEADTVLVDNADGARLAVGHLIDHGHRRIAILTDKLEVYTMAERYAGYLAALDAAGIASDASLVSNACHDIGDALATAQAMLRRSDPPTAFFATNNLMSTGIVNAITASGGRTALVGFDDFALAPSLVTPITVVRADHERLGRLAAELLLRRIDGWRGRPERITLPMRLVERGSGELPAA
jgi:LacI family transcriptional regulator